LWTATGAVEGTAKVDFDVEYLLLDPSGRWLIAAEHDGVTGAAVFDTTTMREVTRLAKNAPILWATVDRARVMIGAEHAVHVFELGTWTGPVVTLDSLASGATLAPDGRIITASADALVRVWDRSGHLITALSGTARPAGLDVSQDDRLLAVATGDGSIDVWDLASYRLIATMHGHRDTTLIVKFDPSGGHVLSWGEDGRLASWALPRPTRSQADLAKLVKCRVPLQLDGETVLPRTIDFDDPSCR
jgi:WD40 repeat protein